MDRTGPIRIAWVLLILLGIAIVAPSEASAQQLFMSDFILDGEPTDPEGVLLLLSDMGVDTEAEGLDSVPQAEDEYATWLQTLMNVLRIYGLLP